MSERANAATAAVLTGLAALIVWLLNGLWGIVDVPPAVAATLAGIVVWLGISIQNRGIKGLARMLWSGDKEEKPEPVPRRKRTSR